MPLRDHFHPPLADRKRWDAVHGGWPMMIVMGLNRRLPQDYVAAPLVHLGTAIEIDVGTFEEDEAGFTAAGAGDEGGGVATAVWAPPTPTLAVATDLLDVDEYEVLVYDEREGRRLVAAVELVSPSNKDRPGHRNGFVAKCAALLQKQVCVSIVDVVTDRNSNLYHELLGSLGLADPALADPPPSIYAVSCRHARRRGGGRFEAWSYPLTVGQPLPTLPLWLADNLAVPLELEASYEETCRILRLP